LVGHNCDISVQGNELVITPREKLVKYLHMYLKKRYNVKFVGKKTQSWKHVTGLKWLGETPKDIRKY